MRIVIPGGSGHIGTLLARALHADGVDVVVLSRAPRVRPWRVVAWDGENAGPWHREIDGADALVNLAGRSVNCRYTVAHRREILHSRVASTRAVGEAIRRAARPPRVWLQAGTATIYPHSFDLAHDERSETIDGRGNVPDTWRFSVDVARAWEAAVDDVATDGTRKVVLRSAMTMGPDVGGVFDTFACLVRRGLGGCAGDGRQFVSWVHHQDFVASVRWLIARDDIDGLVNVTSPHPLPNAEFMRVLRRVCGRPFGVRVREWMCEIGAAVIRTETELILKSRRVIPGRLLEHGFRFQFPEWADAAEDLCRRWRAQRRLSLA